MPGAGNLDRRIVVQRSTMTTNALGEDVESWSTFATLWAERSDISDGEKLAAGQVGAHLRSRFLVRSNSTTKAITPSDRISYEGVWSIHGLKESKDGRNRFIEITAVKDSDG